MRVKKSSYLFLIILSTINRIEFSLNNLISSSSRNISAISLVEVNQAIIAWSFNKNLNTLLNLFLLQENHKKYSTEIVLAVVLDVARFSRRKGQIKKSFEVLEQVSITTPISELCFEHVRSLDKRISKEGRDTCDVVRHLYEMDLSHVLSSIFSHLSPEDLCKFAQVKKKSIFNHPCVGV